MLSFDWTSECHRKGQKIYIGSHGALLIIFFLKSTRPPLPLPQFIFRSTLLPPPPQTRF